MNREFKFRGWDETNKTFYYVDYPKLHLRNGNKYTDGKIKIYAELVFDSQFPVELPRGSCYPEWQRDNLIIQQFTGLKNYEGREIYEGDIIKWESKISKIKYENQKSINDFSNKVVYDEKTDKRIGVVVFDVINDIDDFYSPKVLGYGARYINSDTVTSLYELLALYSKENVVEHTYWKEYGQNYEIIGNILETPDLLTNGKI